MHLNHTTPDSPQLKTCTKCDESKPATPQYFSRRKTSRDGLMIWCKPCMAEYQREWRQKNAEHVAEYQREYSKENAEHIAKRKRKYLENNRERRREYDRKQYAKNRERQSRRHQDYHSRNRERIAARKRAYRQEHRERLNRHQRARYATNRERMIEYARRWQRNYPEKVATQGRLRRAQAAAAEGTHTAKDIQQQYDNQRGRCYYCQEKVGDTYHVDHVIPLSRGGSNDPSNLVIACPTCNQSKGARLPHEFPEGGRLL